MPSFTLGGMPTIFGRALRSASTTVSITGLLEVVLVAVVWDVLLTPFVLPPLMRLFARLHPQWATQ